MIDLTTLMATQWWFRERIRELKLQTWFHPSVSIQRSDNVTFDHESNFTYGNDLKIIMPGDLLHVDFGITYLRLNTDTQQHAYVLNTDEKQAPVFLQKALSSGNKLQDIFTKQFSAGATGNDVLKRARENAISQGTPRAPWILKEFSLDMRV